jgi:hypothetical protein
MEHGVHTKPEALFYWVGERKQPKWRRDNIARFRRLHPEFTVVDETVMEPCESPQGFTDKLRVEFCAGGPYRLWMDSDIELHTRLPLGDLPALGYEQFPHHTICWSGARPEFFAGSLSEVFKRFKRAIYSGSAMYIKEAGIYTHWRMDLRGKKVNRNTLK